MMAGGRDKSSVAAQHLDPSIGRPILMSKIGMAMADFLETDRLLLRPFVAEDLDHLVELDADPEVMTYLTGGKPTPREAYVESLPGMMAGRGALDRWIWAAVERAGGDFIGWFSLRPDPARGSDEAELGYRLRRAAWGQGYATEGAARMVEAAFAELGLQRVFALTMTVNLASRRVMEKVGLTHVRTFFEDWPEPIAGSEHGDVEYALTRAEWDVGRGVEAGGEKGVSTAPKPC